MTIAPNLMYSSPAASNHAYPTSDGRPMGETDLHRRVMFDLIESLTMFYAGQKVYVSGNLLLFYEPGNKRRHVSPDVLVTLGLEMRLRLNYLLWEEGMPPNLVIEVTSASTRVEDLKDKLAIYRDKVGVKEYFLFDPQSEYLDPPLQGFRLQQRQYVPIEPIDGRLPSQELGLMLERSGSQLRLLNPANGKRLPTPAEAWHAAEEARQKADEARQASESENARLRAELEALRQSRRNGSV